jgi:hypothetical protein
MNCLTRASYNTASSLTSTSNNAGHHMTRTFGNTRYHLSSASYYTAGNAYYSPTDTGNDMACAFHYTSHWISWFV